LINREIFLAMSDAVFYKAPEKKFEPRTTAAAIKIPSFGTVFLLYGYFSSQNYHSDKDYHLENFIVPHGDLTH